MLRNPYCIFVLARFHARILKNVPKSNHPGLLYILILLQ